MLKNISFVNLCYFRFNLGNILIGVFIFCSSLVKGQNKPTIFGKKGFEKITLDLSIN